MNRVLRVVVLLMSMTITAIIVGLAYFSNYESILEKPSIYLILFLLFINIIANIFQIIDFLERHLSRKENVSKEILDKKFYNSTRDLEVSYPEPYQIQDEEKSDR